MNRPPYRPSSQPPSQYNNNTQSPPIQQQGYHQNINQKQQQQQSYINHQQDYSYDQSNYYQPQYSNVNQQQQVPSFIPVNSPFEQGTYPIAAQMGLEMAKQSINVGQDYVNKNVSLLDNFILAE